MTDDTLPIVFKANRLSAFFLFACCAFTAFAGVMKISDDSFHYSMERWGPFTIEPSTSGWLMVAISLPAGLVALTIVVRGCPRLALAESGIVLSRCFRAPVTIAWSELADVTVMRAWVPSRGRSTMVDAVFLVTRDGKKIGAGPVGKSDKIEAAVRRVAARMTVALPKG
jgi:hypothetical protein